ncbi:MAG TPA: response regulator [Flavisolibacter sp.]|nr:response regulator [Flavisolibacter sp.]
MQKNTILWADDDADDLMLMKEILLKNNRNFEIVEVRNGQEVLDYLQKAGQENAYPSLIILDINMPIMDGKETLSHLKQSNEYAGIPVVIFTTSNSEIDKLFCRKYQVEMITKPPHYKSLEKAVLKLISYCNLND